MRRRWAWQIAGVVVVAMLGAWLGLRHQVRYYNVTSGSMMPTLQIGQRVAIDPQARIPAVGDIVVFHPPAGAVPASPVCGVSDEGSGYAQPCGIATPQPSGATLVKRVVAGPGDLIALVGGHAVRNGVTEAEPYLAPCGEDTGCSFATPVRVPQDEYYVLGDNRGSSDDSRYWGPVPSTSIIGVVVRCSLLEIVCHPVR